jgi:hypothetical protein
MTFRAFVSAVLLVLTLSMCAFGQTMSPAATSTPLAQVQLPTYIMAGGSCNQFTGCAGFVSAIVPESSSVGLYGSVTTDISAVKIVDPVTKKTGYGLSPSVRAGQHKVVLNANKNMVTMGGDFGASFAQAGGATAGVTIGVAGSFTITYIRQLTDHWAVGIPLRMLWLSGAGPNGTGVWNPVVEVGMVWRP